MGERRIHDEDLRDIIEDAVSRAFERMGIQDEAPHEMQADFQWIRRMRQSSEALGRGGILALITLLVGGLCTALWLGLKAALMRS